MTGHDDGKFDNGSRRPPPVLTIDYALYDKYLADAGLTEAQKREFLDAMWSIIVEFVMLGFEVHPVQQAEKACGEVRDGVPGPQNSRQRAVKSRNSTKAEFRESAGRGVPEPAERIEE